MGYCCGEKAYGMDMKVEYQSRSALNQAIVQLIDVKYI